MNEWMFFLLSVVGCTLAMLLFLALYRNWNVRRGKSCDWCDYFCSYGEADMCTRGSLVDEPVPFIRTCFLFRKKTRRSSLQIGRHS